MIPGFEYRWQVEAQLAGFEHERKGAQNQRHLDAIAAQEAIFKAELERMTARVITSSLKSPRVSERLLTLERSVAEGSSPDGCSVARAT
jgi:hypothetical protein